MNWVSFSFETGATVIESAVALIAVTKMSGQKYSGKRHVLLMGTGIALLSLLIAIFNAISTFSFLTVATAVCFAAFFTKLTSRQPILFRAAATVFAYLVINAIDLSLVFLAGLLTERAVTDFHTFLSLFQPGPARYLYLIVDKGTDVLLYFGLCRFLPKMQFLQKRHYVMLLAISTAAYVTMSVLLTMVLSESLFTMQTAVLLSWLFIVLCVVMVLVILFVTSRYESEKRVNDLLHVSNVLMAENYQQIQKYQEEHAKQLHDFNHHISVMRGLALQEGNSKIVEYADSLLSASHEEKELCHSGNNVIDAIINRKAAEAKELSILFAYSVSFPTSANIDPVDICAILANQIDNALEACKQIKDETKRKVEVKIWQQTGKLAFFQVKNSAVVDPFNENGELVSTKKDRSHPHGLGVKNIRDTAEKYRGALQNSYQDGQFISTAFLCFGNGRE